MLRPPNEKKRRAIILTNKDEEQIQSEHYSTVTDKGKGRVGGVDLTRDPRRGSSKESESGIGEKISDRGDGQSQVSMRDDQTEYVAPDGTTFYARDFYVERPQRLIDLIDMRKGDKEMSIRASEDFTRKQLSVTRSQRERRSMSDALPDAQNGYFLYKVTFTQLVA